jgi:hypothetical protein
VVWIGGEKLLIALQRIALDRGGIGVLRSEVAERPRAHSVEPLRRDGGGWRVRRALEEDEARLNP